MFFELQHKDKKTGARAGIIHTDHGDIETPMFMPVGTQAAVKTLDQNDLADIGAQIILGNTYHLHLRPGEDLINSFSGLHKFMNWNKPILTDSGGFQVFSLAHKNIKALKHKNNLTNQPINQSTNNQLVAIDEDGVTFRSHIDGSAHRFTPESAIDIQHKLGADIIMAFDECTPDNIDEKYVTEAMERTHRWAERSLAAHKQLSSISKSGLSGYPDYSQFLFGIIQGSNYKHLRQASAKYISSLDFDGIAIGGESVGYNMEATKEILDWVMPIIPENKPHYAMGVGLSPADLLVAVEHGVDMFDCVGPTRLARHGMLFVDPNTDKKLRFNITNAKFEKDFSPIDKNCSCHTCQNYSRAYLHHLFNAREISAMRLASIHNLHFMIDLMKQAREAILEDRFTELLKKWI
ncbi:MAG: tRNA guanosine(34) transglycosylase Tgt [Patescibacteria group bacterium]